MDSIKLIVVGETNVGKTSIISQYINNAFSEEYSMTMNSDKLMKDIELSNGSKINIEIWDTIGQSNYRIINNIFMKNTKIALLVYDITDHNSFDILNEFYKQVIEVNEKENIFFAVAGNKSDKYEEQVVSKEEGEEYAKSINALFFETSATDHQCIENLFKDIVNYYDEQKNPKIEEHLRDSFMLKNNKHVNNNIQDDKKNDDNNNDDNNNVNINNSIHKEDSNNGKKKCC